MKAKVHSFDGDTDFFDIVARFLLGDILIPHLFIFCLDYKLQRSIDLRKENGFTLKLRKKQTISCRNFYRRRQHQTPAGVFALLANTPAQAESLLLRLEQTAEGIDLHVNAYKTEYMCFKWGAISTLNGRPLELDKFTYLGSNISSTESDVSTCLEKTWTAIDRL